MYSQIVILKKLGAFDGELTYKVPDNLISDCKVGDLVEINFQNREHKGVVIRLTKDIPADLDTAKIKPITSVLHKSFLLKKQINLACFMADYYQTKTARALKLFLPRQIWAGNTTEPKVIFYELIDESVDVKGIKQKKIIGLIAKNQGRISLSEIKKEAIDISTATLKSLVKKGILKEVYEPLFRSFDPINIKEPNKVLTSDQKGVLDKIKLSGAPILLHGVTGSGKTEIYLRKILDIIEEGKQAILLLPEIALTPQTINYFKEYLEDSIAVFHSKLSDGQRSKEWWKVKNGHSPLIIGSRSAIFAPVSNLGLIILDEEHEWTYKQESTPYYETHKVAEEIHKLWNCGLIFGSATPKAESYEKAEVGDYVYLNLPNRISKKELPKIHIADLREEFKKKNFSIFSLKLQNKIKECLQNKEQIILFVNQRGMANAVVCRDCGYTEKCPNCDISLKLHGMIVGTGRDLSLQCHYCNFSKQPVIICPQCRSPHIRNIGVGTQRVESEMNKLFPQAKIIRADSDTTKNKEGFAGIYKEFLNQNYDVLIGTQMIAKGLDFSNVSLIGIILADIGLHIPDFRSAERLFQILTQVAGRCGRGEKAGEVILQTYNPNNSTIQGVSTYSYDSFIQNELKIRSKLGYPPFNRMIKFTVVGNDLQKLQDHIKVEQEVLEDVFKICNLKFIIVSAPAMLAKRSGRYYYNVLLRAKEPSVIFNHWKVPRGWRIDVDPVNSN